MSIECSTFGCFASGRSMVASRHRACGRPALHKRTVLRIPRFRLTSASIQDIDPLWVQCRYVNPLAQLQSPAVLSAVACYAQAARVRWPGITKRLRLPERSARHWRQVKHKEAGAAGAYLQRICEVTVYVESVKTDKAVVELSIFYT